MLSRTLFIATSFTILCMNSSIVLASGSDVSKGAKSGSAQLYNVGKQVYRDKFECSGCSMAGKSLDKQSASALLKSKEISTLSEREAKGLQVYLTKKFDL